ncbi:probable 4-coumarate--CoA ligase 2, partial [Trichoplusia ni]|uniref:Probable 4-coumarate--CoA ligase 2 n=1 Tax=Trichoplusia ni TaxID=7111 RepID=A0A7E5WYH6_TRINI
MVASQNNYHLGHLILDQLRKRPDAICQIDAATGKSETNASVLSRAVRLARCLRRLGAQPGDLLALHGRNHLDLLIPFYAALFNGLTVCGVDPAYRLDEIKQLFIKIKPKIVFCQSEIFLEAVRELSLDTKVVTFYDGQHSMENFIREYHQDNNSHSVDEFTPAVFDTDKIYAF